MSTWLQVPGLEDGALIALRRFLSDLLRKGLADAVLVPRLTSGGDSLVPALSDRVEALADADPIAPVMPVQAARIVSALTAGGAPYRLAAVLKPCEVRATIELAKLKQVDLARVVLIGVDCLGTYEMTDYAALVAAGADPTGHALAGAAEGHIRSLPGVSFRPACQMCEQPIPQGCALSVHTLGLGGQVLIQASDDLAADLGYPVAAVPRARTEAVERLVSERTATRERLFAEIRGRVCDVPGLVAEFSRCIRCYNCMVNCPICYCRECVFRTSVFDHPPLQYQTWLRRRGSVRLPADTLLFHLTRLNHMVASCVGCGVCSSVCPSHLPVANLFRSVGQEVQALFGYAPGRSLDDELPVAAFREDELADVVKRDA